MKLVLVRHGYSVGNKMGTYTGWSDVEVAEEGIEELYKIKKEYNFPTTDRYYTSDLIRTIQTFEILFGDKNQIYEKSADLREIYFGELEDKKGIDFPEIDFPKMWSQNERHLNWETKTEFTYRVVSKIETILRDLQEEKESSATIVCHSGVIKTILIFLAHRPYYDFREIKTPNGLGYILDVDYDHETAKITLNSVEEIKK